MDGVSDDRRERARGSSRTVAYRAYSIEPSGVDVGGSALNSSGAGSPAAKATISRIAWMCSDARSSLSSTLLRSGVVTEPGKLPYVSVGAGWRAERPGASSADPAQPDRMTEDLLPLVAASDVSATAGTMTT